MQEGGDWTKELEDALEREQESLEKLNQVELEKSKHQSSPSPNFKHNIRLCKPNWSWRWQMPRWQPNGSDKPKTDWTRACHYMPDK
jgi:hypothetical protein